MRKITASIVIGAALLMSGCANKDLEEKQSGFLKSYKGLEEDPKFKNIQIAITDGIDFSQYNSIMIDDIIVMSGIPKEKQTLKQKQLYKDISDYLTSHYKEKVRGSVYNLAEEVAPKTMRYEIAISAVEVHFDDMSWYQYTPITLALTGAARSTYSDEAVRILGEARLVDAQTGEVLMRARSLQTGEKVTVEADELTFKNVKPGLDGWLKNTQNNLKTLHNYKKDNK